MISVYMINAKPDALSVVDFAQKNPITLAIANSKQVAQNLKTVQLAIAIKVAPISVSNFFETEIGAGNSSHFLL